MKSLFTLSLFSLILFVNCSKNNFVKKEEKETSIPVKSGMLHFSSSTELHQYLQQLSTLNSKDKIAELRKLKIKTLDVIYNEILEKELIHQDSFYKGLNPNLGISEYENLGFYYNHTNLFDEYLQKGIIRKIKEKDAWSFELFIDNPGYTPILNENGEVMIADTIYQFVENTLILINSKNNLLITKLNFTQDEKAGSNWTRTLNGGNWIYDGSNKRFKAKVYGSASTSGINTPGGIIISSFYVESKAEIKRFGNWSSRTIYMPIYSFNINWNYSYLASQCLSCQSSSTPFLLGTSNNNSSYSWHSTSDPNGQTNLLIRYFNPNGTYTLPNPWIIFSPLTVNFTSTIVFSGGASGYTYNI